MSGTKIIFRMLIRSLHTHLTHIGVNSGYLGEFDIIAHLIIPRTCVSQQVSTSKRNNVFGSKSRTISFFRQTRWFRLLLAISKGWLMQCVSCGHKARNVGLFEETIYAIQIGENSFTVQYAIQSLQRCGINQTLPRRIVFIWESVRSQTRIHCVQSHCAFKSRE